MKENGLVDFYHLGGMICLRMEYGNMKGPYSWWSNRGQARALDRGWRIDYILANDAALNIFEKISVLREGVWWFLIVLL